MIYDFCIIGGGIAGLTLAHSISEFAMVAVIDEDSAANGSGAVSAGMLAPLVESKIEEQNVVALGYEALSFYPKFVQKLQAESNINVGYKTNGTLLLATDQDEEEILNHRFYEYSKIGLDIKRLSSEQCRELEPNIAPRVVGGLFSKDDVQINNRLLLQALLAACKKNKVHFYEGVKNGEFEIINSRTGEHSFSGSQVLCGDTGSAENKISIKAKIFIVACGAKANKYAQACGIKNLLRPVKGQILRLDQNQSIILNHTIRTPEVYIVPKSDGSLVVGASTEDKGFDKTNTAGEIYELLRASYQVLPGVYELPILELNTGFRPATIDNEPVVGESNVKGIYFATGYYRHGILFSPLLADLLSNYLLNKTSNLLLEKFSLNRFY